MTLVINKEQRRWLVGRLMPQSRSFCSTPKVEYEGRFHYQWLDEGKLQGVVNDKATALPD